MDLDLSYMSALEIRALVQRREISPVEVLDATLRRMEATEPDLNAFVTRTPEMALAGAKRVEAALQAGEEAGLLAGLPLSIKDLTAVKGVRFTSGSRSSEDFISDADSPASERVALHGALMIGKTTTTEFGCKSSSYSPLSGTTRNPWDLSRTSGGSSSGAAASVAAGVTPFALGTDGGGSIRIPAALCGLFGIKPQSGRVPLFPTPATPTLAHVGPFARTVRDAALLLQAISGFDARDPAAIAAEVPDYLGACDLPPAGLRIAWSPTFGYARPDREVLEITTAAIESLEGLGCEVELIDHLFDDPFELWLAEFYAGVGTRLKTPLRTHRDLLDPEVATLLDGALGQTLEEYYTKVFARYDFREKVRQVFDRFDLIVSPTLPTTAFDAELSMPPGFEDRNLVSWVSYTYPFNLTGNPAASIPCGFTANGLPVGLQVVAGTLRETDIFRVAAACEAHHPWADRRPFS